MNKQEIIKSITGKSGISPYMTAFSYELDGQTFSVHIPGLEAKELKSNRKNLVWEGKETAYTAIKVDSDLYLIGFDGKLLLLNTADSTGVLQEQDSLFATLSETILTGWENEFHFGAKLSYIVSFTEDSIAINGQIWQANYSQVNDHIILVSISEESGDVLLLLNMDRFVFYGGQNGELCISGAIEVPEAE